jgi:ABC-type phosphate/phosphonate transport system substrate-binding protein
MILSVLSKVTLAAALLVTCASCRERATPGSGRPLVVVFGPDHAPHDAEALRARWSSVSNLKLEVQVAKTTDEAINAIQSGRADAGLLPLLDYLYCADLFAVEPVAQLVRDGTRSTQSSEVVVRADSALSSLDALRGRRVGFVTEYSVTGFLLPIAALRSSNVSVEPVWLRTHDAVLAAVRQQTVDAGATFSGHTKGMADLRTIETTREIANEPLFVQRTVPHEIRAALVNALVAEHDSKLLSGVADATGFRVVDSGVFRQALETVKAAGQQAQDLVPGGWRRANEHRRPSWAYDP